jgi:hypothetical protein
VLSDRLSKQPYDNFGEMLLNYLAHPILTRHLQVNSEIVLPDVGCELSHKQIQQLRLFLRNN